MSPEQKLQELALVLPPPPVPGGNYMPARHAGPLLFLAGVISTENGSVITGVVGADRTVEEGAYAARRCALTQLAVLRQELGSLDRVDQIVSLNGYVNCVTGFADSSRVVNGASDLFVQVFGESGRHARAAIGVASLPRHALVEIQIVVTIR